VFKTNFEAKNYKLIAIDFNNIAAGWKDLVAEKEDVLKTVRIVKNDKLLLKYLHDCKEELYIHELASGAFLKRVPLEIGTVLELTCRKKEDYVGNFHLTIKFSALIFYSYFIFKSSFINSDRSRVQEISTFTSWATRWTALNQRYDSRLSRTFFISTRIIFNY
jgi:hypothetical protein